MLEVILSFRERGVSISIIKVIFTGFIPYEVVDWEVLDAHSGSHYNYVAFNLILCMRVLDNDELRKQGDQLRYVSRTLIQTR